MEFCACPECGLPAEVVDHHDTAPRDASSRSHALDLIGVRCVGRHWFFGARESLVL
jgi:hypothetical protein